MTQIFSDGFESGDFSAWTSTTGSPAVVSTQKHHGTYSAEFDASNERANKTFAGQTTVFVRTYLRLGAVPPSGQLIRFLNLFGGASEIARLIIIESTGLRLRLTRYYPTTTTFNYAYSFQANTWYCIELKFAKSVSGEYRVYLNGSEVITNTGIDTSGAGDASEIRAGQTYSDYTVTSWVDCVVVADAYIGPEAGAALKEVTDTLSLSDVSLAHKTFAVPDLVGLSDAAPLTNRTLPLGDAISLADQMWRDRTLAVTDGVSLSELVERILAVVLASAIVLEGEKGLVTLHGESGVATLGGEKGEVTL